MRDPDHRPESIPSGSAAADGPSQVIAQHRQKANPRPHVRTLEYRFIHARTRSWVFAFAAVCCSVAIKSRSLVKLLSRVFAAILPSAPRSQNPIQFPKKEIITMN